MEVIITNDKILQSIEKSMKLLDEEIDKINFDNEIKDKLELFKKIGDCVNWIYAAIERIDDADLSINDKKIISAFRGAANVQKHYKEFEGFDNFINCTRFPFYLPAILGDRPSITWKKLDDNVIKTSSQIKSFNEVLADKDIMETINDIYKIIEINRGESKNE